MHAFAGKQWGSVLVAAVVLGVGGAFYAGQGNVFACPAATDVTLLADDVDGAAQITSRVSFVPVTDGNPATDTNGYAGSAINSVAFAQNNLITVGDQQFIAYYRRHAATPDHPQNNSVVIGRRNVGKAVWEMFSTEFVSFNINDTHNVISMAIDGKGYLHMSWGMHNHSFLYAKSDTPVTGDTPIIMHSLGPAGMTGYEARACYPIFQTLTNGDVLFLFRNGGSGNGDWYLNRYSIGEGAWAPVHATANGTPQPFFRGTGDRLSNCFYPDRLTLGRDGVLHISGVFRYNASSQAGESGYQTNHRYVYMRSLDGGTSWQRSDGSAVSLPAVNHATFQNLGSAHVPEIVKDLAEGHSIMNMSGMTTDSAGRPIIANWWSDEASTGDHTRQYHVFFHDGSTWHQRTLSARKIDNPAQKFSEGQLGKSWMGRPVVLTDAGDRILVIYNDNESPGITVVYSKPLKQDPERKHWTRINITHENIGHWETNYDEPRWKQDGVLQMLYQKLPGMGKNYGSLNNSTPVSVVEWDARYLQDIDQFGKGRSPQVIVTPDGSVLAFTKSCSRYRLSTDSGATWSEEKPTGGGNVILDTVAGDVLIVRPRAGELWRSRDNGVTWGEPEEITVRPNSAGHGALGTKPGPNLHCSEAGITLQHGVAVG